ncbi:class I SAM-dependent methyltransferase [Spongiimicrobium sp. 3-5]|uniref:class I SAM-dependent methyltransferase n=1 Tax=Spongiimicrobium sp. 3-5 TaxID=3332596 RepID=UPI00397F9F87
MKLMLHYSLFAVFIALPFFGTAQYTKVDWADRDQWMHLAKIYDLAGVEKGSQVADVGCHEGYLSLRLSEQVGETGKVYAVDVREDRLKRLKEHLSSSDINNVNVIHGDYDNPKLPAKSLDVVIVMDTYHEMDDYMQILGHIKKSLKPNGRILILEKLKAHMAGKPRSQQVGAHTLSMKYVKRELKEAGFSIDQEVKDFGIWNHEKNKKMWILVAVAPNS